MPIPKRPGRAQPPPDTTSLAGTTVLLTGASGEIGSEAARRLAKGGAKLAISGRNEGRLKALAIEIETAGAEAPAVLTADLGRRGSAQKLAEQAIEALGTVDALINNAGVTMQGLIWVSGDGDAAREVFETNLWSPFALTHALAPAMVERGRGAIVNVSSMAGLSPIPRLGVYGASRAALAMATEAMELELTPRGVRVVEVVFGPIDTPTANENRVGGMTMNKRAMGQLGPAADTIVSAVAGDEHGIVFYPHMMKLGTLFPPLMRRISRAQAGKTDVHDTTVLLGTRPAPGDSQSQSGSQV
jgi:short-subunit dehydrogenase